MLIKDNSTVDTKHQHFNLPSSYEQREWVHAKLWPRLRPVPINKP